MEQVLVVEADPLTSKLPDILVEQGEKLTDEVFGLLVAELKYEMDDLVNREASKGLPKQQGGIKTDLFAIEKYVDEILEEIQSNSTDFLKQLNEPLKKESI